MFATTRWSLIAAVRDLATPDAQRALADLCGLYWYPVYAFVRRKGYDHHAAEDLTQGFFARLLEKHDLAVADQSRGRFRSFLLSALQHYLSNRLVHDNAKKRGGGRPPISLDFADAAGRFAREPENKESLEREFDRRWALELLARTVEELRLEYAESGRAKLFDALKTHLTGGADSSHAELARQLGMTVGAVKVAVHRLRQRYRDRLRAAIADTVADAAEVDEEIRDLFAALG